MKKGIHPEVNKVKVTCSCGNSFETLSTTNNIHVEICSKCHPFYTGEQKFIDQEGRIDVFERKRKQGEKMKKARLEALRKKISQKKERESSPKTLKDMLKDLN